jgi:hypothetical protein
VYPAIYEEFSFLIRRRGQNGRILLHSRAMSGSAGLSPSRNPKPEGSTSSEYARNLRKECVGLVAGQAVLTADAYFYSICFSPLPRSGSNTLTAVATCHSGDWRKWTPCARAFVSTERAPSTTVLAPPTSLGTSSREGRAGARRPRLASIPARLFAV